MAIGTGPNESLLIETHVASGSHSTPQQGTGTDTSKFDYVVYMIHTTAGSTFTGMTIKVQDSPDNSTWTLVQTLADPGAFAALTPLYIRVNGFQRYIKLVCTPTGGSWSGGVLSVLMAPGWANSAFDSMTWFDEILTPGG